MSTELPTTTTVTREKALKLLGTGLGTEIVANALGVTPQAISNLLADESFAAQVAEIRFTALQSHTVRDNKYDELEDSLLDRFKASATMMFKPGEILRAIQVINAAKRRGVSAPEQLTQQNEVVQLTLPAQIVQHFTTNIQNQVITAGTQELLTVQAGTLLQTTKQRIASRETHQLQHQLTEDARLNGTRSHFEIIPESADCNI